MRVAGLLALAALAGCEKTEENVTAGGIDQTGPVVACGEAATDPEVIDARQDADAALRRAIGKADPVAEAARAIAEGDFRLIALTTVYDLDKATFGARCVLENGLDPWTVRGVSLARSGAGVTKDVLFDFGRRYNREIVTAPGYPYADICRPASEEVEDEQKTPSGSGYLDLKRPTGTYDLAEAARRGDAWRIRQVLRNDEGALDRPDLFGMTPLAWAVSYRKPLAIDALLDAGAKASGVGCAVLPDARAPIQVARAMKWQSAVLRMRPRLDPGVFEELREEPAMIEDSELAYRRALIDLGRRYERELRRQKESIQRVTFQIDARGNPRSCVLDPGTKIAAFDAEICEKGVELLHWKPARNPFGVEVPGETTIAVRTVGY
ncbi:hypothetical protein B2G71_14470 [Novosphingobium sp. PC22D]|nr:hypothetical protein B2G71_14470 [Novosphingobium sp. PC22D]